MPVRVDILVLDGVLDAALGVTVDVLAAANRIARSAGAPAPFEVVTVAPRRELRTGTGMEIRVDALLAQRRPDVLVVLGMNLPSPEEIEAALARSDVRQAIAAIRRAVRRGALVCTACSGTFLCAESGVLAGRPATTSWWLAPYFRLRYPDVLLAEEAMVAGDGSVRRGGVVTAGAALAHVDLMLWLTRRVAGPKVAALCTRYLVVDERPSQARFASMDQLVHQSPEIVRAEAFARRAIHRPIGIADLARAAGTSARTLERRFRDALGMTPSRFLQRIRAERAAHLLQVSKLSVEAIAEKVGYASAVSLRRVLRKEQGVSPRALRGRVQP